MSLAAVWQEPSALDDVVDYLRWQRGRDSADHLRACGTVAELAVPRRRRPAFLAGKIKRSARPPIPVASADCAGMR